MNQTETTAATGPLTWTITEGERFTVAEFSITAENGSLNYKDLPAADLPEKLKMNKGLVISGRGPVWLYGHLVHRAHPFAWVAIYDPRLKGAVVIERHVIDAPEVGETIYW